MPADSQRRAARLALSGGRMLSSGFAGPSSRPPGTVELSGNALGCGVWPGRVAPPERCAASSDADESGTGEWTGALAAASLVAAAEGRGTAGGASSLLRGALTEVSPVNGFLYS